MARGRLGFPQARFEFLEHIEKEYQTDSGSIGGKMDEKEKRADGIKVLFLASGSIGGKMDASRPSNLGKKTMQTVSGNFGLQMVNVELNTVSSKESNMV